MDDCGTCRFNRGELPAPGGVIYQDSLWQLQHIGEPVPIVGWLVLKPLRHAEAFADLTPEEAAAFGPLVRRISSVMHRQLGCVKVYVSLYAEAAGFAHIHVHLIPRFATTKKAVRGPNAFRLLALARYRGTDRLRSWLSGRAVTGAPDMAAAITNALVGTE